MSFETDVFISYAHIDNLPLKEGEKGWVAKFHRALEVRLSQLLGEKPRIWRDQKLQGNDFFGEEIVDQFPKTAVMISIISPRYIKSEWCTREIDEFCKAAASKVGIKIGSKSRIFKIIKTAVPYDEHPGEIADTLGYEFYIVDPDSGRVKELNDKCPGDLEQMYWAKLDDIAHDICDLLDKIKNTGETGISLPREQLTVYLAETGFDVKEQRDIIKRELIASGYKIVPDCQLPPIEAEFNKTAAIFLEQSALSIHLIGGSYGMIPEDSRESIVIMQNKLAAQKSKTGNFLRLIWLLPGADPDDDRQNLFIQQVREDEETQYGAEVIESSIEEFKYAVHDKLKEIEPAPRTAEISSKSPLQLTVYLAEANYELETHRENIKKQLLQRGCRVLPEHPLPLYYPELAETLDNLLEQSDIAVHIIGEGYGIVPDKTRKSIIHIQHERTGEKVQQGKLKRIVHLSPTIDEGDERQATFTAGLKSRTSALPGDHIIETAPQHLETAVMEKYRIIEEKHLQALAGANEPTVETGAGDETGSEPRQIYLICDLADLDAVTGLEDFLYESGFDVRLPVFEGDEADILEDHRENLKTCDAVMIYYGAGSEIWLRSVTRDITKAAGYGRTRPMLVESVFLAPPETRQKVRFRSHDTLIINGLEGFSPSLLAPFIEKLDKGSGGVGQ